MDRRSRSYRIYEAGNKALNELIKDGPTPSETDMLLYAIAVMLTEATKPKTRAAKQVSKEEKSAVNKQAQVFLDQLIVSGQGRILTQPYDKTWTRQLAAQLAKLEGVTLQDAKLVGQFVYDKRWWQTQAPTMTQVIRNLPSLIANARGTSDSGEYNPRHA